MLNLNLTQLIDDAKCYETVRQLRWEGGVCCTKCNSASVIKRGKDETQVHRQRYHCKDCDAHFDDLTGTMQCLPSPTITGMDSLPVFDGAELVESSSCPRAKPG